MPLCITCYDAELLLCLWRYVLRVTSFCYLSVQPTTMLNQGEALMSCSNGPWCCSGIADDHEVGYNDQNDNFMSVIVKSWLYKYSFMNPSKYFLDFLMNTCACRKSNQPTLLHRAEERHWQWCAPTELKNTTLVTVVTLSSILFWPHFVQLCCFHQDGEERLGLTWWSPLNCLPIHFPSILNTIQFPSINKNSCLAHPMDNIYFSSTLK